MDKSSVPPPKPREEKNTGERAGPRGTTFRVYVYTTVETLQTEESGVAVNNKSHWLRDHDRCRTAWYIMHAGKNPDALPGHLYYITIANLPLGTIDVGTCMNKLI